MIDYEDVATAKSVLSDWYALYQEKKLKIETSDVATYSRKSLTGDLARLLQELSNN